MTHAVVFCCSVSYGLKFYEVPAAIYMNPGFKFGCRSGVSPFITENKQALPVVRAPCAQPHPQREMKHGLAGH